jgi:SAM-dependent methyltransferase
MADTIYNDFYARRYDLLFHDSPAGRQRFRFESEAIRHRIQRHDGAAVRILDLGCGTGRHCALLSGEFHTTGLDSSESMLRVARSASPRTTFVLGDMRDANLFAAGAFTHVLCLYGAIHYNRELLRILENIGRWLTPDGEACLGLLDSAALSPAVSPDSRWAGESMVTVFPAFEYRSRWQRADGDRVYYHETFVLPWLDVVERRHEFYIPPTEVVVATAASIGLHEIERVSLEPAEAEDELLLFLRPARGTTPAGVRV